VSKDENGWERVTHSRIRNGGGGAGSVSTAASRQPQLNLAEEAKLKDSQTAKERNTEPDERQDKDGSQPSCERNELRRTESGDSQKGRQGGSSCDCKMLRRSVSNDSQGKGGVSTVQQPTSGVSGLQGTDSEHERNEGRRSDEEPLPRGTDVEESEKGEGRVNQKAGEEGVVTNEVLQNGRTLQQTSAEERAESKSSVEDVDTTSSYSIKSVSESEIEVRVAEGVRLYMYSNHRMTSMVTDSLFIRSL